jgi:hypothetical protein
VRLSENSAQSREIVARRAEALGLARRRVGTGWSLWAPDPSSGDPLVSRMIFAGTWSKVKSRLWELEQRRKP